MLCAVLDCIAQYCAVGRAVGWWGCALSGMTLCHFLARCLNAEACTGINASLQQSGTDQAGHGYKSAQCAAGYLGNLCGLCRRGYGTVKPFVCKKCLSPAATITLYAVAALVMLVAVRVLSALSLADSGQDTGENFCKFIHSHYNTTRW